MAVDASELIKVPQLLKMDELLKDQTAIVTAGGGGIGRSIALLFAQAGANVVIADILPDRCEEVAEKVSGFGREALPVPTDMMDSDAVRAMVAKADETFGRIDVLVNNAGGGSKRKFVDQSERSWRRTIDLNFISMLAATQAALPVMIREGRGGAIVNNSSIEGSRACPNYAVATSLKAAMNGFTRTLALEVADDNIRVNAIAPDEVVTPGIFGTTVPREDRSVPVGPSLAYQKSSARRIPLGRYGGADECAQTALFLASEMSSYITGTIVAIDGGTWASSGWIRDRKGEWVLAEVFEEDNKEV
jgi:NAD(P)-dependent dehydrogenase (short-subunit alcohol dehydrogenase family)